jgi:GTP-binding protein HflX
MSSSDGERIAWLHSHGQILDEDHQGERVQIKVRLSDIEWARFQAAL